MLDLKLVRAEPEKVRQSLINRGDSTELLDRLLADDARRRAILVEVEELKHQRNEASAKIAQMKRQGQDASDLIAAMKDVGDRIRVLDEELSAVDARIREALLGIPNIPHPSVPVGRDESENVEVRR